MKQKLSDVANWAILLIVIGLFMAIIIPVTKWLATRDEELTTSVPGVPAQPSTVYFETAAHIPETDFPDATRVWFDTDTDRALYVRNDYIPSTTVEIGWQVHFGEHTGTIVAKDTQGFSMQLDSGVAAYGMSGSYVYKDDTALGFVSKAVTLNSVYVVFF